MLTCVFYFTDSWNAALKFTRAKLELITDTDMLFFLDRGLLGGYSAVHQTFSRAGINTKIKLFDVNAEYAWCLMQFLPFKDFTWDNNLSKYTPDFIQNLPDTGQFGCFMEESVL